MARRLYVDPGTLQRGSRLISGDDHHYLFRVLRLRVGSQVVLFDGAGLEASATVEAIDGTSATVAVAEPQPAPARDVNPFHLIVAPALIKGERMEWCIQKLVELGASEIIPVHTERCVVKLQGDRAHKRRDRHEAIARAAAQQSRRASVPAVAEAVSLPELLTRANSCDLRLVLWEGERTVSLASVLPETPPGRACVLIGPEGGLTEAEVALARQAGFLAVGLGSHILRAETAALAAAVALGMAFGDLGR